VDWSIAVLNGFAGLNPAEIGGAVAGLRFRRRVADVDGFVFFVSFCSSLVSIESLTPGDAVKSLEQKETEETKDE